VSASIVLCRGCCCGSPSKRPAVDHTAQRERLERFAADHAPDVRLVVSDCLGPCEQANVVVIRPSATGRQAGARPVWFGLVDDLAADLLEEWLEQGGPGIAEMPPLLELQRIERHGA
jgi:(2Fe-2S) ferredoxin